MLQCAGFGLTFAARWVEPLAALGVAMHEYTRVRPSGDDGTSELFVDAGAWCNQSARYADVGQPSVDA